MRARALYDEICGGGVLARDRKKFFQGGTTADEAVRGDIDFIREQNKLKTAIPLGQVVDYGILREVLAEMKR